MSTTETAAGEHAAPLAVERRRLALDVLSERTTPIELGQLAAEIVAQEERLDAPPEEVPRDVTVALHHIHLPKLVAAGVLDYDPESHVVKPVDQSDGEMDRSSRPVDSESSARSPDLGEHVTAYFDASNSGTASLDDLARYTAIQLSDTADWSARRIRLRLHHLVLPRLADTGTIDYDTETTTVRCQTDSS